ncbi:MAG: hypothetical protein LWY06_06155 [Firmicutes bacterium]|nr:hypothetical protein [Bacillota bacterium]
MLVQMIYNFFGLSLSLCQSAVKFQEILIAGVVIAAFLVIYTIIHIKNEESGCCGGKHTCHVCACGRKIRDAEESDDNMQNS